MPIKAECSECGHPATFKDESAGKKAKCRNCGMSFLVPSRMESSGKDVDKSSIDDGEIDWKSAAKLEQEGKREKKQETRRTSRNSESGLDEVNSAYTPSGRIGPLSWIVLPLAAFGGGLTAYVLYCVGAGLIGVAFGSVGLFQTLGLSLPGMLFAYTGKVCFWLAMPVLLASVATPALAITVASKLTRNRNGYFAALMAAASVLFALFLLVVLRNLAVDGLEAQLKRGEKISIDAKTLEIASGLLWIEVPVYLVVAGLSAFMAGFQIGTQYYCEKCQVYLKAPKSYCLPSGLSGLLAPAMIENALVVVTNILQKYPARPLLKNDELDEDGVRMDIHSCPKCSRAVVDLYDVKVVRRNEDSENECNAKLKASIWVKRETVRQIQQACAN